MKKIELYEKKEKYRIKCKGEVKIVLSGNIDIVDINHGLYSARSHDHLCLVYKTFEEWRDIIVPFIQIGLQRNEKCLYIGNEFFMDSLESCLKRVDIDTCIYQKDGQLVMFDTQHWISDVGNNFELIISKLQKETEKALCEGYDGLRVTDDMSWLQGMERDAVIEYEAKLNRDFMEKNQCLVLCQYNEKSFDAGLLQEVLICHPMFVRKNQIYTNSFYIPPEILLSDQRDQYQLEEWFNNMERERLYGDRVGLLTDVLQRSSQPFVTIASTGYVITCNNALCELLGFNLNEMREMNWWSKLNTTTSSQIMNGKLKRFTSNCWPQHLEHEIESKNGNKLLIEEFIHQVCDSQENVKYYCSFINDITVRKRNEEALKESEKLYRALFKSMHEGFALCEIQCDAMENPVDFCFLEVNRTFEKLSGAKREELIGKTASELDADLYSYWNESLRDVALNGMPVTFEYYHSKADKYYEVIAFSPVKYKVAVLTFDITPLKRLEKELQEQLHFLQNFIDSVPTPAFYRDTDGNFQYCNKPFETAIGLSRDQIVGQSLYTVLPRDLADKYREMDLTLLSTSGIQCYDWEFQYADGTRHDVIFNKAPLSNSRGDFIGIVGTTVDITQRKRAQEALRVSEEKFRNIFTQSPIGIALYNSNGMLVEMNQACLNILGITNSETIKNFLLFDEHFLSQKAKERLINGKLLSFQTEFSYEVIREFNLFKTTKNGSAFVDCTINPINSHDGSVGGFLVHIQDVSEQKKAEDGLKKSEADLRRITENMVDMISQTNMQGTFEFVSPSHKNILGYEPDELMHNSFFDLVHLEDIHRIKTEFNMAINSGLFGKTDYRYRCQDGTYCHLETVGKVICEDGKVSGIVLGTRDITQRKQMEKEIARLDRLRAVGEMAASLGHEIRNPMTTVRGFLQVLGDREGCQPYQEYFDLMIEELDSANAIVTEFLSLAKDKVVYFTEQNLNVVVKAMYPLIAADAIKSDKQVFLELQEIPEIFVDAKEIRQLILNLTRNGLESMESGGELKIRTKSDGHSVILEVEDEGHGIDPEILDELGTPFFTTKENGTGLGLAICYSIVARHHAAINISSGKNGSVFSVTFNIIEPNKLSDQMIS